MFACIEFSTHMYQPNSSVHGDRYTKHIHSGKCNTNNNLNNWNGIYEIYAILGNIDGNAKLPAWLKTQLLVLFTRNTCKLSGRCWDLLLFSRSSPPKKLVSTSSGDRMRMSKPVELTTHLKWQGVFISRIFGISMEI